MAWVSTQSEGVAVFSKASERCGNHNSGPKRDCQGCHIGLIGLTSEALLGNFMLKTFIATSALLLASAGSALAGPYINIERNDGFLATDDANDWGGAVTEAHLGYEGQIGSMPFYIQGGPAYLQAPGADGEGQVSGKVGGSIPISDKLGAYFEASFLTGEDSLGYGSKLGAKYTF